MTITRKPDYAFQPASEAMGAQQPSPALKQVKEHKEHLVQFYENEAFLMRILGDFIETGLVMGESSLLFVTAGHLESLAKYMQARGYDLEALFAEGKCRSWDADQILAQVLVDGMPERERFTRLVQTRLEEATRDGQRVRVFGEIVVQLWTEASPQAAMRLEELWNELHQTDIPFSLLCAYPMHIFAGEHYEDQFMAMCRQHSHVIPDESYPAQASSDERLRAITLLQQKAASLATEIEERKKAEESLRISENHYRRLFEASIDGILMLEAATGTIHDANPFIVQLTGYPHAKLLGQELWQLGLFANQEVNREMLQQLQERKVLHFEELTLRTSSGRLLPVEMVSVLYQANGSAVIQCIIHDITERKRAEEASLYLAAVVASSSDAILSKTLDGIVTSWNLAAERMYGYSAQEMVGQPVTRIFLPDRLDEFSSIMERIRRGEPIENFETQRRHKDGHMLEVAVSVSPIMDKHGVIIGASSIARNIGKQKELERQREAFIGLVTHELRNPLAALQGNVQVARRLLSRLMNQATQLTEDQHQLLEDVLNMLGRSQQPLRVQRRLIDDLLDLSRIQQDQVELCLEVWNLDALVREVVQDHQAAYPNRLISLELPEVDSLPVHADRDRITQVLGNYITNALKFAPEDQPIRVGIEVKEKAVRVWVKDRGPGLSEEQRAHIWERFAQVAQTPRQGGWRPGLGLGLYLCQQLISRQGGEVGVESAIGQGATFWFSLPLYAPSAESTHEEA